ncbi:MAG: type II toxin-antitoxin system RelE/ParE family toxin [Chloroflexi bacterium]|nr:type II toxin-antitoxin system RelE/ParE family toxin [Chloroflexota bacterium]
MDVVFASDELDKLETDPSFTAGYAEAIVNAFRKVMQLIRNAPDERDFYALRGLRFEKLAGSRRRQHSMRLNDQYRLIAELDKRASGTVVKIVGIEDYH